MKRKRKQLPKTPNMADQGAPYIPTPEKIAEEAAKIRAGWKDGKQNVTIRETSHKPKEIPLAKLLELAPIHVEGIDGEER